jgi:beta-1,4-mannosyl-glycoprotein beta-1,4-N-acetylglucosaminyltransferase
MLIDAFPFFNELDILEIRLAYLNDIVDYFVLVEASKTQSLLDKPFHYELNQDRFHPYKDKIIHVKVEDYPDSGGWAMEHFQRNCIVRGLGRFKTDDLLMISDVDEIPNKIEIAKQMLMASINLNTMSFSHKYYAYYLNLLSRHKSWYGTVLTNVATARSQSPQSLRNAKDFMDHPKGEATLSGWHFGWCGGWEKVQQKLVSCIEPFNKESLNFKELKEFYLAHSKNGGYFIHCENPYDMSVPLEKVSLDTLPYNIEANKHMYTHLILP